MTTSLNKPSNPKNPIEKFVANLDPIKLGIVACLIFAAFIVLVIARSQVVQPIDNVVTERLCLTYGEELDRTMTGYERSNRFGLRNRSEGFCQYGEGPEGEAPITLTIEETQPGRLYRLSKIVGILLQFGIASIFLRLVVDPIFDLHRMLKPSPK